MGHRFELPQEAVVGVTPEEVWEAIATGPGVDSWFMGRTEVTEKAVRTDFGGLLPDSAVTVSDPPHRFAHASPAGDDGRFVAYEFLIEGREQGSTVVRMVTSGFLPGDDWETEYEAMRSGLAMFFATLVEYLGHFPGRPAAPVTAFGPPVRDWPGAWRTLYAELGLPAAGDVTGRRVVFRPEGLPPVEGVVYYANAQTLGIRTPGALYRFIQGLPGVMVLSHVLFGGGDAAAQEAAWQAWLGRVFAD
ncbi:SRPBCC domain-containing protein [Nonomuraea sp. SMC257]|uniref:SRPBCC domain-containing protein n=1 Tax=Nonomuraea montanisoli TaxID=2741721 RepID=A0A7Y6I893_9ACTN|nr:SRPBCC domain-containing protein [Nonomuraea montanisoli]NUW32978.1 SRPBCC domain-containing protein [Nonomuraea montanisoli]